MKNLVIVESPAKAKTIEKYLGKDFKVLSSVGHIRKDTKITDFDTFEVNYEITDDHQKIVKDLARAAKSADQIWLATDEDREGEAISWHLLEVLDLPKSTKRITFHEITKPALEAAIKAPRQIDMHMVDSQRARQTLDMLVGYDLSGVVRKKVPGAISAGRVQSPALRLLVEREREIDQFATNSTFKITADFGFPATLDQDFPDQASATTFLTSLINADYTISDIKTTPGTRNPSPPFTTATLQIEASSKLGFSTSTTMRAAQALYQAGHITYHRTDSMNLSQSAIASISSYVEKNYGANYLKTRNFKTKSASAQEAHEAIRPSHIENETAGKNDFEKRLYSLIRSRALATQMSPAKLEKTTVIIDIHSQASAGSNSAKSPHFLAKGEVITFDGFLKVYGKWKDTTLPSLTSGDHLKASEITAKQTFGKPPARYTEGSLVKKLEELGIGRPSTYASIISAIQFRGYAIKGESEGADREVQLITLKNSKITQSTITEKSGADKGKLVPTPIGELITDFLTENFQDIVDYGFTADIENDLDRVAEAKLERVQMLRDFYGPFSKVVSASDALERFNNATELGKDPKTGKSIYAKIGKNGEFIQVGENEKESGEKPRFAPLPKGKTIKTLTYEDALKQLELPELPRSLGLAADGTELIAASGPFGPYLKAGAYNVPLKDNDPYTVSLKTAEELYEAKKASIIADWGDIQIIIGAYGPYVKGPGRRNNAKIPADLDPKKITEEEAKKILEEKPAKGKRPTRRAGKKSTKRTTKRKTTKKPTPKKSPKKTVAKKTSSKKTAKKPTPKKSTK